VHRLDFGARSDGRALLGGALPKARPRSPMRSSCCLVRAGQATPNTKESPMAHLTSLISNETVPAKNGALRSVIGELWEYRELFYYFAWRDIKVRYKQTVLGALWAIIQPLFTMLVFTFLFGKVANLPSDGLPKPLFYFCALVPWTYFSSSVSNISMTLLTNSDLLTKIYFPRIILPSSTALSGLMDFSIASVFLVGFILYYHLSVDFNLLLWPLFTIALVMLALGVGMILAALNVKYRDFRYVVPFGIQLWLFVTPIIYPMSSIPEQYRWLFVFNPLSGIIEGFRYALVPAMPLDWGVTGLSLVTAILIFVGATMFFSHSAKEFADYV
jgi:lipopolysaccharide transport system permease protein